MIHIIVIIISIIIVILIIIIIIIIITRTCASHLDHSCHILPFQPIVWSINFPPEPANTAKHSPKSISEGKYMHRT